MRGSTVAVAAFPVAAALAALAAAAATGFSQRDALPPWVETRFYGFFLDRYPLYAFALVYGLARLVAVAAGPGPGSVPRRVLWASAGIAALLAASLYPTFGGMILRSGFATGGVAFLSQQPLWLAYASGAAAAAFGFGTVVGLFGALANRRLRPRTGWPRGLAAAAAGAALSFLALWFAAGLLGLARAEGIGPWPRRAFTLPEAGLAGLLVLAAALPHAVVAAFRAESAGR